MPISGKNELRSLLRQRRRQLPVHVAREAARAAADCALQLPGWDEASRVALYLPADGEVDTRALCNMCRVHGKQLFLPVIAPDNHLDFALWQRDSDLVSNRFGIPEPPAGAPRCPVGNLDVLFMPLVGWDRRGGRLGMGGGFYDRTLAANHEPTLVGLAHAVQEVAELPMENWDVYLDFIITERELHRAGLPVQGDPAANSR